MKVEDIAETQSRIEKVLLNGRFNVINNFLKIAGRNIKEASTDRLITYLTATLPAHSKLPYRGQFYKEVEAEIKRRGHWEEDLLRGLEGKAYSI